MNVEIYLKPERADEVWSLLERFNAQTNGSVAMTLAEYLEFILDCQIKERYRELQGNGKGALLWSRERGSQ